MLQVKKPLILYLYMVEVKHYRYSIILYIIYIILSLYIYILYYIYYVLYIYIYYIYIYKVLEETCYQSSFWTLLGGASLLTS